MKDLLEVIEESKNKFENLKCVNYAMYFGCVDDVCNCGEEKCNNRQTVEMAEKEYKDFFTSHTKAILTNQRERMKEKMKDCGCYKNTETGVCRVCDYTQEMRDAHNIALQTQIDYLEDVIKKL